MNIFVGGISYHATEEELEAIFLNYGTVSSCKIITDHETGRSRGFGFVEMSDKEEGQAAIDALNESDFMGRTIKVNEARPRGEGRGNNFGGGGGRGRGGYDRGGYNRGGGHDRDRGGRY